MDIIHLNAGSAAIFIGSRELDEAGLTAEALEADSAGALVECALDGEGLALDGPLEIEAYAGGAGVLLFAHVTEAGRVCCRFDDLDTLAAAARDLAQPAGSLCYIDGSWCLLLRGDERALAGRLSEFGAVELISADRAAHLAEHGRVIFPDAATEKILQYFA